MADFNQIGQDFVKHYYTVFDAGKAARAQLANLYSNESMLTFNGEGFLGTEAIVTKLTQNLHFDKITHEFPPIDCQPSPGGGVIILVGGNLIIEGEDRPMPFTQTFHLVPLNGSYYVHNDIFKLNLM